MIFLRLRLAARRIFGEAVATVVAALLFLVALGFGGAAIFIALADAYGAIAACGIMAGVFALLGVAVMVASGVWRSRQKRREALALADASTLATLLAAFLAGYRSSKK